MAPPSKSYTHRAIVLGALTHGPFTLKRPLLSEDTRATLDALHVMGASVQGDAASLKIHCDELGQAATVIDARNSGTTMRLMTGIAALQPSTTTLTGDESLVKRPMAPLVDALGQLGAKVSYLGQKGMPPLKVTGPIKGQRTEVQGGVSSQFVSSLLIACTQKADDTEVRIGGEMISRPYVDITLDMLRDFGGEVRESDKAFEVKGGQRLERSEYTVPGDYSSAAFALAAGAVTSGDVTVTNLDSGSPQGDKAIVRFLKGFGAEVRTTADSVRVAGGRLEGLEIDVKDTPDLFPVLAVLGAVADGATVIKGGANLRYKESDRIATTTAFLRAMGARVRPTEDGCEISGGAKLHGADVDTHGDHRILMAAALAGLVSTSGTRMEDDSSYEISYPGFLRDMHQLGCRLEVRR
jgi:3-phosphoshikimate 1-carboxyvinyltransferase